MSFELPKLPYDYDALSRTLMHAHGNPSRKTPQWVHNKFK